MTFPFTACGQASHHFHREDVDIRPSAESYRQFVVPELLAAAKVWVYGVADGRR